MRKPRTGFILIGITAALCLTIFVYFDKRERNLVNMILRQNHAASDTHDPIFVDKMRNTNIKYSRDENMDDEEKWNNDQSASEKYSRNVLVDKGIQLKLQLPLKGQTFNPVVRGFVEQLKRKGEVAKDVEIENIGQYAKSHLQLRDTDLNAKELKNIKNCKATSKQDYKKNYGAFFGGDHGRLQNIRRTHHTYLDETKFMIEVGGNWGWDAGNFSKLYNMNYLILEPLTPYTDILEKKFAGNEKVSIYNVGLGSDNEVVMVNLEGNNACATTKFSKKNGTVPIYIVNAIDFLTDLGVGVYELDLLTMNCEGCEFEVLETLVKSNLIERIRNIQWATHTQVSIPNPWERYCRIHELLKRTHRPTYQYKFNWESWRRKDIK